MLPNPLTSHTKLPLRHLPTPLAFLALGDDFDLFGGTEDCWAGVAVFVLEAVDEVL